MAPIRTRAGAEKRVFTMLEGERPLLAFEAHTFREAQSLCRERWLRDELLGHGTKAGPVWDGNSKLTVRQADESEVARYRDEAERALQDAKQNDSTFEDPDDLVLAYLVPRD